MIAGDWDDLSASVDAVADHLLLGVLSATRTPKNQEIRLVDIRGRPVSITATRASDGETMLIRVHAGRFGDPPLETDIFRDLRRRLAQLKGVDWAPIDW